MTHKKVLKCINDLFMSHLLISVGGIQEVYFRQGHPKGVACEPLTAATKETLFYAQGGRKAHWA